MDNVVDWNGVTRLDSSPSRVLEQAALADLQSVIVIGYTADGDEYFCASMADGGEALWHLERAKLKLLMVDHE